MVPHVVMVGKPELRYADLTILGRLALELARLRSMAPAT